jgi:hypothetical protein
VAHVAHVAPRVLDQNSTEEQAELVVDGGANVVPSGGRKGGRGGGGFLATRIDSAIIPPPPVLTPAIDSLDLKKKTPKNLFLNALETEEVARPPTVSPRTEDTRRKLAASFETFWPEE